MPAVGTITVSPASFTIKNGKTQVLTITINAPAGPLGQYFGQVNLTPTTGNAIHLPVAFNKTQGSVSLDTSCAPGNIHPGSNSTCTVTAENHGFTDTTANLTTTVQGSNLSLVSASGATVTGPKTVSLYGRSACRSQRRASRRWRRAPDPFGGHLDLAVRITPNAVGDETILNFDVPAFQYASATYTSIGFTSNGYAVVGGGDGTDVDFVPQTLPDPAKPNNVLAPFWTDLNGTGAPGIYVGILTDQVNSWIVADWHVFEFGTTNQDNFEVIIGINGSEDISYALRLGASVGPAGFVGVDGRC